MLHLCVALLGGNTIHGQLGIGINANHVDKDVKPEIARAWEQVLMFVIDEVCLPNFFYAHPVLFLQRVAS